MIFFSSFGSILPYLLYLSVVWLCILVGFRGNLMMREKSQAGIEKSADLKESAISDHQVYANFRYPDSSKKNNKVEKESALIHSAYSIYQSLKKPIFRPPLSKEFLSVFYYSHLLRGPPKS